MAKVRLLILSSFAAGFGLCSIIFSVFTMISEFNFYTVFRFILTLGFFAINLLFTLHYYGLIFKEFKLINKMKAQLKRFNYNF
ncbi:MAG TPA: hypothetical protein DDZ60_10590 [Planktothrix sp. UBA10369]|jgi:hypothetical protein|nr:hypothetical protein [Planktothrix sp. UBA10369]